MTGALQRAWMRRGPGAIALWPLSLLYGIVVAARRMLYDAGVFKTRRVTVPVIVVGNVIAGGAGKTPVVIAIVEHLRARGIAAGVVSRGHGRRTTDVRAVRPDSDPAEVGDEPLLIARRTRAPVFVARKRADAALALLSAYPATEVIVCDDGLQHLGLQRDLELCVFDDRGLGNGWLLPAGPLRERWPRKADLVLRTADAGVPGHLLARTLESEAVRADGTRVLLGSLNGPSVIALAGVANPGAFFDMLRAQGLVLASTIALADHADPAQALISLPAGCTLVCTEKDAVKVWRSHPAAWAVPLALDIAIGFWRRFDELLDAKLSSRHGSPPA